MRDRLRDAGKDVRYVERRGDEHWLWAAQTRIEMLRLAQHLPVAPKPATPQ